MLGFVKSTTQEIASVMRRARKAAGCTQAELAEIVGTSQSAISAYESGSRRPSPATTFAILSTLRPPPGRTLVRRRDEVLALVAAHRASNLRVFGSVARCEDTWRSDIDLLVSLDPGWSLSNLHALTGELERIFGPGRVDLFADGALPEDSPILAEAVKV